MYKKLHDFRVIVETLSDSAIKAMHENVRMKDYLRGHNEALRSLLKIFDLMFSEITELESKE